MKKEKVYLKVYLNKKDGRMYMALIKENGELLGSTITDSFPELINADNKTLKGIGKGMKDILDLLIPPTLDEADRKDVDIVQVYLVKKPKKFLEYFN